ncbi:MAG: leucyl/phenylalanyl-tRNA--protein transferase [Chthoniobacterales bacterium]
MYVLTPEILLLAYRSGVFPMGDTHSPDMVEWFRPDPRGILPLAEFHIPHGLRRQLKKSEKSDWEIRIDEDFERVMRCCAARRETWITEPLIAIYCELHRRGVAHSLVVCKGDEWLGGLYGVHIGGAFFGESMFHNVTDASKVALFVLVEILNAAEFSLLDMQWTTPHLVQFGAKDVSAEIYEVLLRDALAQECEFLHPQIVAGRGKLSQIYKLSKSYCK